MNARIVVYLMACLSALLYADEVDVRSKLSGTWRIGDNTGKNTETWLIEERPEAIHLTHSREDAKTLDFECNSEGRECRVKEDGKQVKVSLWFSGPKLVQLEIKGNEVVKRRFAVTGNGDTMDLEVIPVVPTGKPAITRFERVRTSAARQ